MRRLIFPLVLRIAIAILFAMTSVSEVYASNKVNTLALTSSAASDQGIIPVMYTCDGKNISPALAWTNIPPKTQAFALILADPDAPSGTFYHWALYNIPKDAHSFAEDLTKLPAGTVAIANSWGKKEYNGPCPPKGSTHHYIFSLYALDNMLKLPADADITTLLAALQSHIVGKNDFVVVYSKWPS